MNERIRGLMRAWAYLVIGFAVVAGAAYGVRQSGIDFLALTGMQQRAVAPGTATGSAGGQKSGGAGNTNRGPLPVETTRAKVSEISDDISAIGNLLAEESVAIAPETSGRVAAILFKDGDNVKQATELFRLDADLANAALAEAKARLDLAEANYARNQALRKSGNISQSTYDAVATERDLARTAVESALVLLRKLTITAPFSGTLGFRSVSEGAYVTAGTPLVQLDKTDRLKVSFSVPELQQGRIVLGQAVSVIADALPNDSFTATVSALSPSIDVNGRALQVRADLDNAAMKLRPGLLVRITVKGSPRRAVLVPESAITQRGEAAIVYVVSDGKAREAKVKTGRRLDGKVEIVEGIAEGEEIVTAGAARLSNGAAVEVMSAAAAAE